MDDDVDVLKVSLLVVGNLAIWMDGICIFLILISRRPRALGVAAAVLTTIALLLLVAYKVAVAAVVPATFLLVVVFGWLIYAYRHYRQARQDELLQVVTTATEAGLPLAPAVWAYWADQPREW